MGLQSRVRIRAGLQPARQARVRESAVRPRRHAARRSLRRRRIRGHVRARPSESHHYRVNLLFDSAPWTSPGISPAVADALRIGCGVLMLITLIRLVPDARRYFLSERWGGYGERGWRVDLIQNPVVLPALLIAWIGACIALAAGRYPTIAAAINLGCCYYFFIAMRWRGVLRGLGAPGFIATWLAAAVLLIELTRRHIPELQGLALFALQIDFAPDLPGGRRLQASGGLPQRRRHGARHGQSAVGLLGPAVGAGLANPSGVSLLQRDGVGHRGRGRCADAGAADALPRRGDDPVEFHLHRDADPARISVRDGDRVLPGLLSSRQRG